MARSCFVVIVMSSPYGCVNHVALTEIYPPAAVHPHTLKGAITACAGNRGGSSPRQRHRRRRSPHRAVLAPSIRRERVVADRRFVGRRTLALASVTATVASAIESTIESRVSRLLGDFIEKTSGA